ncbi:MAG: agmatinase [Gammaproteobacteria bacterium]|nr:agmatinase [Gammaproteobacteria bacterium]MBT8095067.1 agmatinase [Gammaproteobacteria bacterium]MBT8106551.1 agmatinase [Gammaproteobacteria bacterium]
MHDNDFAITREDLYGTTPETTYAGITSFMRRKYTRDLTGVDVAVTGVPFDTSTTNRPGARFGPRAIRSASTIMAWEKPYGMAFDPFDKLAVADVGDCLFDHGKPESVPAAIEAHATNILSQGPALLTLGGDHFISYPILKAHAARHGAPLSLLHFDAHSDTWRDDHERVDHGTMFYWAAREGIVDPASSIQVGLRTENPDTQGFNIIDAPGVHERGIASVIEEVRGCLGDRPVYATFDIDCLDPAYAPGTGTPVCGGLTTHQAMAILRGLAGINVIGMDVVEVAPAYDIGEITSLAASHIAMEMLYLYACAQAGS